MRDGYDAVGFYHDSEDRRLWVPKRNPMMGWTINLGHRFGRVVLGLIGVAAGCAIAVGVTAALANA